MRARASMSVTVLVATMASALIASPDAQAAAGPPAGQPRVGAIATPPTDLPAETDETVAGRTRGQWTVTSNGPGQYTLSWTSPDRLPVTDARPEIVASGPPVGMPELGDDGRTVSVAVESATVPDVDAFDVVLSGQVLDSTAPARPEEQVPYRRADTLAELTEDPGEPGTHEVEASDYSLPSVALPDIPQRAEMLGHVVEPVDADDSSPLVLFLHGRHSPCYRPGAEKLVGVEPARAPSRDWSCRGASEPIPSYLGYDYVQRLLASQGYVTVSISANAINALDFNAPDGGAAARAALIRHHLEAWADFVADGTHDADLSNVVLVGHSRGGEGANRASLDRRVDAPYEISGQILIGPTDFGFQASPYTPTVTILPYCDGDVSDLQGQNFTDAARDLVSDDIALHSSVMVMGANHNFFNTEWTPGVSVAPSFDDWFSRDPASTCGRESAIRLSKIGQRLVGKTYIAGAVHLFADGDQDVLPMFDGSAVAVPSADNADVRSHAIGGGLETRRPALDASLSATDGASTRFCTGRAGSRAPDVCEHDASSARTPHWPAAYFRAVTLRKAFEMRWSEPGQEGGLVLDEPWDLSGSTSIDLRTIVQPGHGPVQLSVRLHDADGRSVVVVPEGDGVLSPLPGGAYSLAKRWAQDLRVLLDAVAGVDLTAITRIDLRAENAAGSVWVLDVSAIPSAGLPAPTNRDVPKISLGNVVRPEGDGPGETTVSIPYLIGGGPLTEDARVRMVRADEFGGSSGPPEILEIPAGTTAGTVDVTYRPNTIDDLARRRHSFAIFPVVGVATNRYIGGATIVDDDPSPRITVSPVHKRIREGRTASWRIALSAPTGYYIGVIARPIRAGGGRTQLTVGDLPKKFRESHFFPVPPLDRPLFKTDLRLFANTRPGHTSFKLRLPTKADRRDEGARSVAFRFRVTMHLPVRDATSTVVVTD